MPLELRTPVKFVKRIGERVAESLATRGIETVEDLLYHLPFRYEDRLHPKPLGSYAPGEMASVVGEVRGTVLLRTRSKPIFEMTVGVRPPAADSPGAMEGLLQAPPPMLETVKCLWFNGTYLRDRFRPGQTVALYGKLDGSRSGSAPGAPPGAPRYKMIQPTFEILPDATATGEDAEFTMLEMGRIVPVYESLGGKTPWGAKLTSRWLRRVLWTIFRELADSNTAMADAGEETLPTALRARLDLPSRMRALEALHFPPAGTDLIELQQRGTPAYRRLIFEEFWYLELGLELKRRRFRERAGTAFVTNDSVRQALKQVLPFKPTAAQKRVLGEIVDDMRSPRPMRRLLQGDVGSGKTIVALQAALVAIENGYQAALMAPTEILATQHFLSARKLLADARSPHTGRPYRVSLLTGSLDDRTKRATQGRLMRGETDLAIGTHALVEDKVEFDNLGLVIVDEQHRFGVQQRFRLMRKPGSGSDEAPRGPAAEPDVLIMTATPIPRTLALTVYGDLEVSVLDELPPGRTPVVTRRMPGERSDEVWAFVRKQVAAGRQAYIVYPTIEGRGDDQPELDFAHDTQVTGTEVAPATATFAAQVERLAASHGGVADVRRVARGGKRAMKSASPAKTARPDSPKLRSQPKLRSPLRSATEALDELHAGALTGLRLGLLHGRMSADDKDVAIARFKRGDLDVLIATTVIEVGVDVANASLMVIENAERFGLAQLHQLRGRVGRGSAKSYCVLLTGSTVSPEAEARLDALVQSNNGFELAEIDLAQRGPGEFFGTRQAGLPDLRVADLTRDRALLELAKTEATRFAAGPDPAIPRTETEAVWGRLRAQWQRRYGLVEA